MTTLVALLTGLAVLMAAPPRADLGRASSRPPRARWTSHLGLLAIGALAFVRLHVSFVLVIVLLGAAAAVARVAKRRSARRAAAQRRELVLSTCEGLAADLAAGLAPSQALLSARAGWSEFQPVVDAARIGADVPAAFGAVSELPGAGMLRVAAAAWGVAERSGGSLADAVAFAADSVRAERDTEQVVAAELAAALATAKLLALLPVGILILGRGMGGDPFGFLVGSTAGQVCLASGLGIAWLGMVWLEHIVDQVENA